MLLRTRIILTTVVSTLFVAIILVISGQIMQQQVEQRFVSATTQGQKLLWEKIIDNQLDTMETGMSGITRDRDVRKALKKRDSKALGDYAAPAYKRLSTSNVITKMQLVDLDNNVLFSAPDNFSGKTVKTLAMEAIRQGKITSGVERDDSGELDIVLAFPLMSRGKPVGVGIYMRDFKGAVAALKNSTSSDVFVIDKNNTIAYQTDNGLYTSLDLELPEFGETSFSITQLDKGTYASAISPILDPKGQPLAHLITSTDYTESYAKQQQTNLTSYLITGIGFIVIIAGFTWYIRKCFGPLETAVYTLEKIAEGDLTHHVESKCNDEIGKLMDSMETMVVSLREIITKFRNMGGNLNQAATEMQNIATTTTSGIERQTAETEQVATAMHEMTVTVQDVARNAEEAARAASEADSDANGGREVVQKTIDSIKTLSNDIYNATEVIQKLQNESNNIGSVLDVIRGIAEQTNLLALNAAIEAARAGEQGRGFAVVADEVRTLASRTQQSTQDIQKMIEKLQEGANNAVATMEHSLAQVSSSVDQANQTGTSLDTITSAVSTINEMNVQIASAAEEQRMVTEEINRSIDNIKNISEESAEGARETSASSQKLHDWTDDLAGLINHFKV
ncbi:MAG: methyl-accepting chemotaxis protein [Chromatiales bacterium]|nr:methyl-accepting chemotaxis protein [Chromatiales bacterium]